jgi:hypothetical protein
LLPLNHREWIDLDAEHPRQIHVDEALALTRLFGIEDLSELGDVRSR